jgi:mannose-6-phosphate isomerase-like protein (cupin superfamily)
MTTTTLPTGAPSGARTFYHPGQDDWATFLETTGESGGRHTLLEVVVAPGGGNPPHVHLTYAETFTVVSGTLTVRLGRRHLRLGPGEQATVPVGAVHCFRNETSEPATFRVALAPGHRGFEEVLQIAYGLAADGGFGRGGVPRDPRVLGLLIERSDMRMVGPKALLNPLMGVLAALARRAGLDRELAERYVRV